MELLEEIQYHIKGKLQTCVSSHIGAYEEMLNFINKIEKREQEKPAKESEPAKEIISEIICKECGKEGDLDLEGIWCANCQKYTYSEKPAKENIDLMGQIPIISLANSMDKIKPIYGTTLSGTETILSKWLNGSKDSAIKFLVMCISVNAPNTPNNTEQMAKETIEKWIEDNY